LFIPDYRSAGRQRYCVRPACRKISRRESQRRWLARTGNAVYHTGDTPADRVKAWRAAHPSYWLAAPSNLTAPERKRPRWVLY
jgi:hypothetical protein